MRSRPTIIGDLPNPANFVEGNVASPVLAAADTSRVTLELFGKHINTDEARGRRKDANTTYKSVLATEEDGFNISGTISSSVDGNARRGQTGYSPRAMGHSPRARQEKMSISVLNALVVHGRSQSPQPEVRQRELDTRRLRSASPVHRAEVEKASVSLKPKFPDKMPIWEMPKDGKRGQHIGNMQRGYWPWNTFDVCFAAHPRTHTNIF